MVTAERLGVRVAVLDQMVDEERGAAEVEINNGRGRPVEFAKVEPWPDPVDGAALLDELAKTIRRFVALDLPAADAMALWVVHTHAIDAAFCSPRLAITSPERRCGKTTLLTVLGAVVARPQPTANVTSAALFRLIEGARPTLLLDEADTFLIKNDEMRGVINAGHSRRGAVLRTVETPDGHEVRSFSVWAPMAIAAIDDLPDTIEDRSIKIAMRRRTPDEQVERLRLDRLGELEPIARRAARWAADHLGILRESDPDVPSVLHDRAADNWRPLLAIADAVGGEWLIRAREAAVGLADYGESGESTREALLADIKVVFDKKGVDRIKSQDFVEGLWGLEDRPWPTCDRGKPLSTGKLAAMLKPLCIRPGTVRFGDKTAKGYVREDFEDAFARYLPRG